MTQALFIGIDIGTQGTKGVLCNGQGEALYEAFRPSCLIRQGDAVYEEPEEIFSSVVKVVKELTEKAGEEARGIRAIGMDGQMAGIMAVDEGFSPVTPLDSWLDGRCAPYTERIRREAGDRAVAKSGGQIIHAHAPKILWWKEERPEIYRKVCKFLEPNGYVAGRLCGLRAEQAVMDYTFLHFNNFSDNLNRRFDPELLAQFGVAEEKMPRIVSPEEVLGTVTGEYAAACGLPAGVQVIAGCGDTAASSLGAGITRPGLAYDVAGTASVFACATDRFLPDTAHRTLLFSRSVCEGLYLPLAYISGGGLCLKWFAGITGCSLQELDALAETCREDQTPLFIPHFSGRTFPLDNRISGAFLGLRPDTGRGEMHRAVMESIAYEYRNYMEILTRTGCIREVSTVIGVGGGAKSRAFAQIKADVLGARYVTPKKVNSAPHAMAMLAAHATGYRPEPLQQLFRPEEGTVYEPDETRTQSYRTKAENYLRLLDRYGDYIG